MNELNERDWELVNAYHDGELGDAERQALERRLPSEPALEEALRNLAGISASLGALRPDTQQASSQQLAMPANQNWRPVKWLIGGAAAAAIALAVTFGQQLSAKPSAFDIHADLAAQAFSIAGGDVRLVAAGESQDIPDLASANLTPVATRQVKNGHVTHYAGRNGCRLSYFRGTFSAGGQAQSLENQVAAWSTTGDMTYMIVATGMDQAKFDAIAAYLKLTTQQQASDQLMASLAETTANADRCVG
ncbi:MAG: hypothetical protein AAFY31_16345 [Pseudomonadota bacterium]